jgi:hypothetical protein
MAVLALGLCGGGPGARAASATRDSAPMAVCSEATAQALARTYKLGDPGFNYPVGQVLCGSFTGAQSEAIAFSFHYYGCIPTSGFAVFRFVESDWQLVLKRPDRAVSLFAAGSNLREVVAVFRKGDSRCVWTGGKKSRVWSWDGQQLVASPWHLSPPKLTLAGIYSPSRNLECEMADLGGAGTHVICQSFKAPHSVWMAANGRLRICRGQRCVGNFGDSTHFRRLGYGKRLTVGRFRCASLQAGMKCVVIRSGRGFLIDKVRVRQIGP